jgi:hypothetical protein
MVKFQTYATPWRETVSICKGESMPIPMHLRESVSKASQEITMKRNNLREFRMLHLMCSLHLEFIFCDYFVT